MTTTVTDPEQLTAEELEWLLAERLEGLREPCEALIHNDPEREYSTDELEWCMGGCHGKGYTPHVTLEALVVAMAPAWVNVTPWKWGDGWSARVMVENEDRPGYNRTIGDGHSSGPTPLHAAMVAAVKALLARETVPASRIDYVGNTTS